MNHIHINTKGIAIRQTYSKISTHTTLKCQMGSLHLEIGDITVEISFERCAEMVRFCHQHNFTYDDRRTGVQKYLDHIEDDTGLPYCVYCTVDDDFCFVCEKGDIDVAEQAS